jgi:hypothetical protein
METAFLSASVARGSVFQVVCQLNSFVSSTGGRKKTVITRTVDGCNWTSALSTQT